MPEAGHIESNLKRSTLSYDEELKTPDVEIVLDERPALQQNIEAEQELFEDNYRAAHESRWKGQQRWMGKENEAMRLVNILHPHDFIRKLQNAGVEASLEPAVTWVWVPDDKTGLLALHPKVRSNARLWLHEDAIYRKGTSENNAGLVGVSAWVTEPDGSRAPKYVTSLQWDCGPEWSLMYFDAFDVPVRERYRGWRTALLRLILSDVVTEAEAERAFGRVVENAASELYRETLQSYRERKHADDL
jgi:hypothetical protein